MLTVADALPLFSVLVFAVVSFLGVGVVCVRTRRDRPSGEMKRNGSREPPGHTSFVRWHSKRSRAPNFRTAQFNLIKFLTRTKRKYRSPQISLGAYVTSGVQNENAVGICGIAICRTFCFFPVADFFLYQNFIIQSKRSRVRISGSGIPAVAWRVNW